ncbi:MAG: hypothetical protein CVT99_00450 [Bacteroidetes bacterium HGW-Bacteroidetes-16]|jgi:hypothetical protein|nr:MAG: hypothetical protein CVT99_00450 [Bacteroidetes bacterium HGW-Bacteroidetes-16]
MIRSNDKSTVYLSEMIKFTEAVAPLASTTVMGVVAIAATKKIPELNRSLVFIRICFDEG